MSSAAATPAKMNPQQARGLAEYLLADLQYEVPVTVRVIESATGGNLGYSPDPKSKSGIALVRHVVLSDIWFLNSIADGKFDGSSNDESEASGILTPADGAARYTAEMAKGIERIRSMSDEQLAADLDFFGIMQVPAVALLGLAIKHSIHHRGQLSCYLRAMGCKVPGIYGPSGDTQ